MKSFDIVIIGGGIAGASLAWRLAREPGPRSIALVEAEDQPGQHATGRSAAFYSESYGNQTIRALTTASREFYYAPPEGFSETALLEPSGALFIARKDQLDALEAHYQSTRALTPSVERQTREFALSRVPVLKPEAVEACVWEPDSQAIDVHELLQGYLRGARRGGVQVLPRQPVTSLDNQHGSWKITAGNETIEAAVVVNAAGAWAGQIGTLAGALDIGLAPLRRSVCVIDPAKADGIDGDISGWPLVLDIDETFYFKPNGSMIWLSPAEEDPSPPCDAAPDELTLAEAVDRLERATSIGVRRIEHKWAGLRSFVADRSPVVGFDPLQEGFFWLAGQGGYGIQTSPAVSDVAAGLICGRGLPQAYAKAGVTLEALDPRRLQAV